MMISELLRRGPAPLPERVVVYSRSPRPIEVAILILVVLTCLFTGYVTCLFTGYVAYQAWRAQRAVKQGIEQVQKCADDLQKSFNVPAESTPAPTSLNRPWAFRSNLL